MSDFKTYFSNAMKDPEKRKVLEDDRLEFEVAAMFIQARMDSGLTQSALSDLTGIGQASLSRIECGKVVPDLATLDRVAKAVGKRVQIRLV